MCVCPERLNPSLPLALKPLDNMSKFLTEVFTPDSALLRFGARIFSTTLEVFAQYHI